MTKKKAKKIINMFINSETKRWGTFTAPEVDCVLVEYFKPEKGIIKEFTFKGLLKIAYDLEDKK